MEGKVVLLSHGSGGRLSHELIEKVFKPRFSNSMLDQGDDAAEFKMQNANCRIAFTTDSYVVKPLFFPGGDIGRLAVCGTVNDLAMKGATPLYLSVGFIIEEGFSVETLEKVVDSMTAAAKEAGVSIVTGDTKVVDKGACDGLFINTSGVGVIPEGVNVSGSLAAPGDVVIISGNIGDHGAAVINARNNFGLSGNLFSDVAPLNGLVSSVLKAGSIHVLRDPTRGGLATTLNEIAGQSKVTINIEEEKIPVKPEVKGACEMLGLDPLYVANEGKLIAIVASEDAESILKVMRQDPLGKEAAIIGKVESGKPQVLLTTFLGSRRPLMMLEGEALPRIC
ncbi:MAG: hydrogenase expression/formation protein HypE [Candidatus Edwardsbacteria bacterium]|nr:hydrogenase expression/formation protein HypE [Candidatus Edwardsbacteria bacterium]MBU1575695.1 hydrogenase expression/formation protein HypE [Candidatus Edwardsbacteria bacterium]MBU2464090.1 hydrogenase expression/formation protein HypE [Candidatus Edwardsbacteria bacterium]MBU2594660.1 hydrogenase expression/formation protein HypE [Candidatus Edwardsbacteria bacterium]